MELLVCIPGIPGSPAAVCPALPPWESSLPADGEERWGRGQKRYFALCLHSFLIMHASKVYTSITITLGQERSCITAQMIISLGRCNASQGIKYVIKSRTLWTLLRKFIVNVAVGKSNEIGAPGLIIPNTRRTSSTELVLWWRRKKGKAGLCTGWVKSFQNMKWGFAACSSSFHFRFV